MLYALPTLTEEKIACYLKANYAGSYNINKAFGVETYELPLILIKAGKFREVEPNTGLYEGELAIAIQTQIDDITDVIGMHDNTVALIYELMANQTALFESVNGGGAFNLFSLWVSGYSQDRADRGLFSIIEYNINAQTLAL